MQKLKIFKIPEQIPVWRWGKLTLGVRDQFLSYRAVVELIRKEIGHTFQIQIARNFSARKNGGIPPKVHAKPKNPANLLYFGGSVLVAGVSTPDTYPRILVNFSEPFGTQGRCFKQWLHAYHHMSKKKNYRKKKIFPQKKCEFF